MAFAFEKLNVYQKAIDFANAACDLIHGFPRGYFFLADQLNRAALSIRRQHRRGQRPVGEGRPLVLFGAGAGFGSDARGTPPLGGCLVGAPAAFDLHKAT